MTTPEPTAEALDHFEQWLFNLELECSGASLAPLESIAIGGAVLELPDLLAGIKAVRDKERDAMVAFLRGQAAKWRKWPSVLNEQWNIEDEMKATELERIASMFATNQHRTDHV